MSLALNEVDADVEAFIANADDGVSTATTYAESSGTQDLVAGDTVKLAEDSLLGEPGGVYQYVGADAQLDLGAEDYTGADWVRVSGDIAVTATTGDEPLFTLENTGITLARLGDAAVEEADDRLTDDVPDEREVDLAEDQALLGELAEAFANAGVPLSGDPDAANRELTVYATGKGDDFALSDEGGNTFIISLDPLTGNLAVRGTSINAVSAAASITASFGTGFSAGISGAGAASTNEITGGTNAYISDSVVTSGEDVDLDAASTAVISSTVASASIAVAVGGSNGIGASLGGAGGAQRDRRHRHRRLRPPRSAGLRGRFVADGSQ